MYLFIYSRDRKSSFPSQRKPDVAFPMMSALYFYKLKATLCNSECALCLPKAKLNDAC